MSTQQFLSMAAPPELCYQQNSQLWSSAHPHSCLTLLRFQQLCPSHAGEVLRLDGQSGLRPAILAGCHPDWCQYQAVDQRAVLGSQGWQASPSRARAPGTPGAETLSSLALGALPADLPWRSGRTIGPLSAAYFMVSLIISLSSSSFNFSTKLSSTGISNLMY